MKSKPQLLAWLTCDGVHIDPGTGKHTILGTFSNIRSPRFPMTHPYMVWFLTITDCAAGQHKLRIKMGMDHSSLKPILEREFPARSPMDQINIINEIRNLPFAQPGEYSITVEIDDEVLLVTGLVISN